MESKTDLFKIMPENGVLMHYCKKSSIADNVASQRTRQIRTGQQTVKFTNRRPVFTAGFTLHLVLASNTRHDKRRHLTNNDNYNQSSMHKHWR